ncbi:MAG TPA: HD domain-containing phosphohydrolase [Coleofasciculaceae cyanobacterium]
MTSDLDSLQKAAARADLIDPLLAIGTALSSTYNLDELLELILLKSREITCSDAGSVYLLDRHSEPPLLWFKVAQNFSQPLASLEEFAMPLTTQSLAGYVALTGESLNIADAYEIPEQLPYQLDRSFDQAIGYRTCSVLVLPMQNHNGEMIGVLQLINRKQDAHQIITTENATAVTQPYSDWEERMLRSLASQAAISIERNQLQDSIENLFEGFVKAAVQIIEARDPCTFGHSERVAELTVRLSEEVSTVTAGPLSPIYFNPQQLQEIRYAALLHDFGKVGVPEAILVKQKKLYPLQLEVIRHRFALAQRSLELGCVQARYRYLMEQPLTALTHAQEHESPIEACLHCQTIQDLEQRLQRELERLAQYWQVLMQANEPHILAEEPLAQLMELAGYCYRDVDGDLKPLITPEELKQLMIHQGNLTKIERQAIQSHVNHTYTFLKQIPWTKQLQNVPTIAYSHHEKLDGSGYPLGLKQSDIPIQSQIMAIADIYDALTAGDRPYKQRLSTPTTLSILRQEAGRNKINPELVDLFEQRQVFKVLGHKTDSVNLNT